MKGAVSIQKWTNFVQRGAGPEKKYRDYKLIICPNENLRLLSKILKLFILKEEL
jgi:hypothetical protein